MLGADIMSDGLFFKVDRPKKKRGGITGIITNVKASVKELGEGALKEIYKSSKSFVKKVSGKTESMIELHVTENEPDFYSGYVISKARWSHRLEYGRKGGRYRESPFMRPAAIDGKRFVRNKIRKLIRAIRKGGNA
jgi:hypothetical protein